MSSYRPAPCEPSVENRPSLPTSPQSLLPLVLKAMQATPDARLRQLMASLTTHLHTFIVENELTESEFEYALDFIVRIGQASGEVKNEAVLAADLLGLSTLVALLNNAPPDGGHTDAALLGPFWRDSAPWRDVGETIALPGTPGVPIEVRGTVGSALGQPLPGAVVDVWQASPSGLYENQDAGQPDMNLRGRFVTDAQGQYWFRSVRPAGYPVPTDGPCGELLRGQRRHAYRPAHLHFMISAPAHKVLVTQVFADDSEYLDSDPTFGVTAPLVARFEQARSDIGPLVLLRKDFRLLPGEPVFPHPPIP
jgi:catechol 1,2-dioxygenase